MRILLAEDDPVLSDALVRALTQAGYATDWVDSGDDAEGACLANTYNLVILDLGLPKQDGLSVLQKLRNRSIHVPVLILTARDTLTDRVSGLDLGADDYLTKPFDLPELEARIRALIRRGPQANPVHLGFGPVRLDVQGQRAFLNDEPLELSAKELKLLEILLRNLGRVVSKEQLVEQLYTWDDEVSENAIEVYMHRLRKKLEPLAIRTIRGLGYLMEETA